jgi:glycosyltransferase 2 family protein
LPARPSLRRSLIIAAQVVAAALLFYFVGRELVRQWVAFRATPLDARPDWPSILASGALVLATYAILVQSWRILLGAAGAPLSFTGAARIWSISNLWRYVPGKVWQIGAIGSMAARQTVSPIAAANAALIGTVLNIAAGIAIALALAWGALARIGPQARNVAIVLEAAAIVVVLALPIIMPFVSRLAAKASGRPIDVQSPRRMTMVSALLLNILSWLLYGVAFMWLARGVLGAVPGSLGQYIAIYAASYVVGYLFLIIPGGIGPREAVMVLLLTTFSLATPKEAWLIAGASRVWLTVLEIVPGLLFLANDAAHRRSTPQPPPPTA